MTNRSARERCASSGTTTWVVLEKVAIIGASTAAQNATHLIMRGMTVAGATALTTGATI
jgi:hypothetical protein